MTKGIAMRKMMLAVPFLLSGCAVFPTAAGYSPVIVRIDDQAQFDKDVAECHGVADHYSPGLDGGQIAQAAVTGAASNSAYAVINPLVPAAGAAGGAASATISGLDVLGANAIKVLVRCLSKETERDRSALIADPNE